MMKLFSLKGKPWKNEKVILSSVEVQSLRSDIADLEERESHYKARLEHVDEILKSSRLSGYLFLRRRWEALPGETPPVDDSEVNDWVPRFVIIQGSFIYSYVMATDLCPQDSTALCDVIEVGSLPNIKQEDEETRYCFYILTRTGLKYECSSTSKIQIESWLAVLEVDCKVGNCGGNYRSPE